MKTLPPLLGKALHDVGQKLLRSTSCVQFDFYGSKVQTPELLGFQETQQIRSIITLTRHYCRSNTWLDYITLSSGELWVWNSDKGTLDTPCHVVFRVSEQDGYILFPDGEKVHCDTKGTICLGILFNM
jgi:hypothetical protein